MTIASHPPRALSAEEIDRTMAVIEKGQQPAGHFPDEGALGRARRILEGSLSADEAYAELRAKYAVK